MLPALLDHVDDLLNEGTIGGEERNAADFQIGTGVPAGLVPHEWLELLRR